MPKENFYEENEFQLTPSFVNFPTVTGTKKPAKLASVLANPIKGPRKKQNIIIVRE